MFRLVTGSSGAETVVQRPDETVSRVDLRIGWGVALHRTTTRLSSRKLGGAEGSRRCTKLSSSTTNSQITV